MVEPGWPDLYCLPFVSVMLEGLTVGLPAQIRQPHPPRPGDSAGGGGKVGLLTADTVASQGLRLSRCKGAKGEQTPAGWTLWARSNGGGWSEAWVGSGENWRKLIVTQKMGGQLGFGETGGQADCARGWLGTR